MKKIIDLRKFYNLTQSELANKIYLKKDTIALYEVEKTTPSFKSLIKLSNFFGVSLDFIILDENCNYPKNLKLLKLAKNLDEFSKSEARNNIEATTKNLLGKAINPIYQISQDTLEIELANSFNLNLKKIRKFKNITQTEIGKKINSARSTVSLYEIRSYPSLKKMIKLSNFLNISIHALATGEKLYFNFKDGHFGDTMLMADHLLSFEHQKFLIELMENIITDKK